MKYIYLIYAFIRQNLQPYWVADPARLPPPQQAPEQPDTGDTQPTVDPELASVAADDTRGLTAIGTGSTHTELASVNPGETMDQKKWHTTRGISVYPYGQPLPDNIMDLEKYPAPQTVWYHHDGTVHELLSHLVPTSGEKFRGRNDAARKTLQALIRPLDTKYDRTHLIPFGYHGVEGDSRLLIGWDSDQNRGPMNTFEKKQKKRTAPIYWLARVKRTRTGATLDYEVYDARTMQELDQLHLAMTGAFEWKEHDK